MVWDVAAGRPVRRYTPGHYQVGHLALSPDGGRLYAGGGRDRFVRGQLTVWDVRTGKLLQERPASLWGLSADGKTLATVDIIVGTFDRMGNEPVVPWRSTLTVWGAADFTPRRSFTYTSYVPDAVAVSADGSKVACGRGPAVTVFDAGTGKPVCSHEFEATKPWSFEAGFLAFSPDGKWVAVGDRASHSNPRTVHLIDAGTGAARLLLGRGDLDPSNQPLLVGLEFTPDSRRLLAGFGDMVVPVDVVTGESPPARPSAEMVGWRKSWGAGHPDWAVLFRRGVQPDDVEHLYGFALSGDGKTMYLGGRFFNDACGLRVVDVATRAVRYPPAKLEPITPPFPTVDPYRDPFPVSQIDQRYPCPEGVKLADGRQLTWQPTRDLVLRHKDYRPIHQFGRGDVLGYVLTPDGETVVTRGRLPRVGDKYPDDPQTRFWDVNSGKEWAEAVGPDHGQIWSRRAMAISPDGRTLAALHPDGGIWLWEVATVKPRLRLDRAGPEDIYRFAFSRDGRHVMSNDANARTGLVWDLFASVEPAKLTDRDMTELWADLQGDDAAKAFRAISRFAADPAAAVPFLRDRAGRLPTVTDPVRLAARPFDREVMTTRRAVEALERCGTAGAAQALTELADRHHTPARQPRPVGWLKRQSTVSRSIDR